MTIKASVHDHNIKLPADLQIAEGTEVEVIVPDLKAVTKSEARPLPKPGPAMAWMEEFIGKARSLPPDASERHTELAHGRKRKRP